MLTYNIQSYARGEGYTGLDITDLDGDGTDEIILGHRWWWRDGRIEIWKYNASIRAIELQTSIPTPNEPHDLKAADFDGDGLKEIVVGFRFAGPSYVDQTASGWAAPVPLSPNQYTWQILVEDFDRDGHFDFFHGLDGSAVGNIFYGDGKGGFTPRAIPSAYSPAMTFSVVDVNNDGRPDLLGMQDTGSSSYLTLYLNQSTPGSPAWDGPRYVAQFASGIFVRESARAGDVNGDGYIDSVTLQYSNNQTKVVLFEGGANLTWTPRVIDTLAGEWLVTAFSDVNDDDKLDIAAGSGPSDQDLLLYLGDGTGGFTKETIDLDHGLGGDGRGGFNMFGVHDINGDGRADIVTARADPAIQDFADGFEVFFRTIPFTDITNNTNRAQFKAAYAGDDLIDGTAGADSIRGWSGRDTIWGEAGNDNIRGDGVGLPYDPDLSDTDPVKFADSILAGAGNDSVWGCGGNDTLVGEDGNDKLYGQGGGDSIDGGRGADEIVGAEGNDTCRGGADNDWIVGGPGRDSLQGDDGDDKIYAFAPASEASRWGWVDDGAGDQIEGGNGKDTLIGSKGNETLTGGAGADVMSGGGGDDIFDFNAATETGNSLTTCDVITGFEGGRDTIDLRDIDASTVLAGNNAFLWRGSGPFTTSAEGELRYQKYDNPGTANDYTLIFGDTDADTASEFQIKLQGLIDLTNPATPPGLIGYAETKTGYAVALDVEGQYAYVGTFGPYIGWFQVFDISDPSAPRARGSYFADQEIQDIDVIGPYAYVANDYNGLIKLDISNPDAPVFLGGRSDGQYASSVGIVDDRFAYVGYWYSGGLQVYDTAAFPSAPVASLDQAGVKHVADIDVVGDRAYITIAESSGGEPPYFEVIDISDPLRPSLVSQIHLPRETYGDWVDQFQVVGNHAYLPRSAIGGHDGGLLVLDLTDESKPAVAAFVPIPDAGNIPYKGPGLDVVDDIVYMASQTGLYVFDVSNPSDPKIVIDPNTDPAFRYPAEFLPSKGGWVEVQGDLAFVTSHGNDNTGGEKGGLVVFQLPQEDASQGHLAANAAGGDWLIA